MPAAIGVAAAMVFAWIALIRGAQALDGIVIVGRIASVIAAAGPIKLRTQILRGSRRFRPALHAHSAGEARGDEYGLAAASNGLKFDDSFIDIDFSEAAAINFNVKLCSAYGNNR